MADKGTQYINIRLKKETVDELKTLGSMADTYDTVIKRLIETSQRHKKQSK